MNPTQPGMIHGSIDRIVRRLRRSPKPKGDNHVHLFPDMKPVTFEKYPRVHHMAKGFWKGILKLPRIELQLSLRDT